MFCIHTRLVSRATVRETSVSLTCLCARDTSCLCVRDKTRESHVLCTHTEYRLFYSYRSLLQNSPIKETIFCVLHTHETRVSRNCVGDKRLTHVSLCLHTHETRVSRVLHTHDTRVSRNCLTHTDSCVIFLFAGQWTHQSLVCLLCV